MSFERRPLLLFGLLSFPLWAAADLGEGQPLAFVEPIDQSVYQAAPYPPIEKPIQGKQFSGLQEAVSFYEKVDRSGHWEPLSDGPLLGLGDVHEQVVQLRGLLHLFGDIKEDASFFEPLELFDLELQEALLAFQKRHGAKVDGILGPQARRLLSVPPRQRIEQLLININRQQEFQAIAGGRYLQVNVPEYRLRLYEQGEILLDMKTIIGRRSRQTPIFSSSVKTVVVNPSWSVPKSIAYRDILPRWEQDKTYLSKHNLQVLSGWEIPRVIVPEDQIDLEKMYRGGEFQRLWEPPSMKNTLGRIKFQLDSNNSIYLHDTKSRSLFESDQRAFSSGCIRLEKPRMLADALRQHSNRWVPEALDPLFEDVTTHNIRLDNPIALHVTYWTAWLDENNLLHFAEDLYRHDLIELAQQNNENLSAEPAIN
ncbi:MAG: L,D-transpeptidase family protein [Porticoccus sp.]|nr:L,D-transpeptidase family protein [Porticoccus sp.]